MFVSKLLKLILLSTFFLLFSLGTTAKDTQSKVVLNTDKTGLVVSKNNPDSMPPPQLGVAPSTVNREFILGKDKRIDESLTLYNYSAFPKAIQLTLFDLGEKGKPIEPSENTLLPWTLINPASFTIPPNGHQTIRLAIVPPYTFSKGEHRALLMIEQQIKKQIEYDEENKSIKINLGSRYGLPVRVDVK